jgi:hypothetical protein
MHDRRMVPRASFSEEITTTKVTTTKKFVLGSNLCEDGICSSETKNDKRTVPRAVTGI